MNIKEKYPFYGLPRVYATLRREGFVVNKKRVHRLLKVMNMLVPIKRKRKKFNSAPKNVYPIAAGVNETWAMDFVFDRLQNGTPFRSLTIIDTLSRYVPGILVSPKMEGFLPVDFLEELKAKVKLPKHIVLDNGPEFLNHVFVSWCERNSIALHFIDPGKPVQNAFIESFNGKYRNEFLNQHNFKSMDDVRRKLNAWVKFYNEERPHSSLDFLTPKQFADQDLKVVC